VRIEIGRELVHIFHTRKEKEIAVSHISSPDEELTFVAKQAALEVRGGTGSCPPSLLVVANKDANCYDNEI
jgi:hypothetical protein